jgi:amino acid transporter
MHRLASKVFVALFLFFILSANIQPVFAATPDPLGLEYGAQTGLAGSKEGADIRIIIARIINIALGLLGTIFIVIMIFAGFEWMTAGGNEDKTGEAKKRITAAVIGLAIVLSAYAITNFVVKELYQASTNKSYDTLQ